MSTAFARLAWKDAIIVWPIVAVIVLSTVVFNALTMLRGYLEPLQAQKMADLAAVLWVLLPGLLAFGMPAMLVGTEQESGTLNWLRTLAVPRRLVINSKVLVAISIQIVAWIYSSAVMHLVLMGLDPENVQRQLPFASTLYVTLQFLLGGFVTSYLFRSPITGLLAVIPLMILLAFLDNSAYEAYQRSHLSTFGLVVLGVSNLLLLWGTQYWLANRRMRPTKTTNVETMPRFSPARMFQFSTLHNESEYQINFELRLPVPKFACASTLVGKRPSQARAMLWQAVSQQFALVTVLTILCLVMCTFARYLNSGLAESIGWSTSLIVCWLGCLSFYHDSLHRRHLFYGERGFSKSSVWLTRMVLPLVALLLLSAWNYCMFDGYRMGNIRPLLVSYAVAFACGALASVWVTRPVLAFLVGPILTVFIAIALGTSLYGYSDYLAWFTWAAIPILFATWRLQRRWMNGQRDLGFHWRCVAFVMLGPLVVCFSVYGHRLATMPKEIPQWRAATLAEASEINFDSSSETSKALIESYQSASFAIGVDVNSRVTDNPHDLISLLRVSRQVRQAVIDGHVDPRFILRQVERDEALALSKLQSLEYSNPWIASDVVELLPPDQIRSESRRLALLAAWEFYQRQSWDVEVGGQRTYGSKSFEGFEVCPWRHRIWFERTRADRAVDIATQATLEYVEHGLIDSDTKTLRSLWLEALGPYVDSRKSMPISLEADALIARYRELAQRGIAR